MSQSIPKPGMARPETVRPDASDPSDDELVDILRRMIDGQVYSTRCFNLQRQGRMGTMAPIDGSEAPYVRQFIIDEFSTGTNYSSLTITSTRRMHLQLAESALAGGDAAGFATHVNHVRAMDGLSLYTGGNDMAQLMYERQANLIMEGSRLGDMYRFGITDDLWLGTSEAITQPGSYLPITNGLPPLNSRT